MTELTWKYVKPIKDKNALINFEKNAGIQFPNDLKEIIFKFNNGRPSNKYFDTVSEKECEFKKLLSLNTDDTENIYDFLGLDTQFKSLVAFASNSGGNLICLYQGKIVYWKHESDQIEPLADTFSEFLEKLY
ncbi:hypothetical protein BKG94_05575 [Rodentibacter ratti]|uniref:SMI1/KNR4 family protein n=1 Tax=Rodentibacter ratti TaxID=1906745 RepID=UPI0009869BDC|nr:SMI1/KNR4 family protein [Rodentibacter ratti]OOF88611.1 hypothetical protein BKG94_05575 [Rodentibacter ratti]